MTVLTMVNSMDSSKPKTPGDAFPFRVISSCKRPPEDTNRGPHIAAPNGVPPAWETLPHTLVVDPEVLGGRKSLINSNGLFESPRQHKSRDIVPAVTLSVPIFSDVLQELQPKILEFIRTKTLRIRAERIRSASTSAGGQNTVAQLASGIIEDREGDPGQTIAPTPGDNEEEHEEFQEVLRGCGPRVCPRKGCVGTSAEQHAPRQYTQHAKKRGATNNAKQQRFRGAEREEYKIFMGEYDVPC
ncbi:hypothetical protein ADUPG1_007235 [Aduncisulcus paluster]|uniref:Uncharacterized protein n=1 Tax=Aduncisulcus paluster TaxID=2918883 RepID=A0ABQ5KLB2_9EUKA|nr:hypothetical protein ADUPG1_007235 [Aduncisulcus paluster]